MGCRPCNAGAVRAWEATSRLGCSCTKSAARLQSLFRRQCTRMLQFAFTACQHRLDKRTPGFGSRFSIAVRLFKLIPFDSVTFHRFAKRSDRHFANFVLQTSAYAAEVNHLNRQIAVLYKSQERYYEPFSQTVSIIVDARGAPIVSDIFLNA